MNMKSEKLVSKAFAFKRVTTCYRYFTVESEGTVEQEIQAESQGLLQEFIDYITVKKVVVLEELAAEFGGAVLQVECS